MPTARTVNRFPELPDSGSKRNGAVAAATIAVVVFWASAFVAIRWVGDEISPGPFALGRQLVAAVVLTIIALWRRPALPRGRALMLVICYGLLWFAGYTLVLNVATQHLDAGTTSMLVNIAPLIVAVVAGFVFREGFPISLLVGIGVAFAGVVLITTGGVGPHSEPVGIALGLLAAALYASGVLVQKAALRTVDPLSGTWVGCVGGALALMPFFPALLNEVQDAAPTAILATVYLGAIPSAAAFLLWAWVLKRGTAGATASATLAVPAVVILLSWLALGELPTLLGVAGGALCLAGVALSRRRPARLQAARD